MSAVHVCPDHDAACAEVPVGLRCSRCPEASVNVGTGLDRLAFLSKLSPEDLLEELLATIHGDGGHYSDAHGLAKATADAEDKWHAAALSRLRDTQRVLVEALRELRNAMNFRYAAVTSQAGFSRIMAADQAVWDAEAKADRALASVEQQSPCTACGLPVPEDNSCPTCQQPDSVHLTPAGDEEVTAREGALIALLRQAGEALRTAQSEMRDWYIEHPAMKEIMAASDAISEELK